MFKKPFFYIFWLTGLVVMFAWPAAGQTEVGGEEHLFTVYGIEVDETAANATIARRNGLAKAEREAFEILLQKLVRPEDLARFSMPPEAEPSDFVLGIEVEEERNSRVRYIGTVNITFAPEKIEALLAPQNIPFVAFAPEPVMIFPILEVAGTPILWGQDNTFLAAWRENANDRGLLSFILPKGTLNERISLSPGQILEGRQENQIRGALSEYGAESYWAVVAKVQKSTLGELTRLVITFYRPLEGFPPEERAYSPQGAETPEQIMARAIQDFYARQERNWKTQALTQFGESREMALLVPVESPSVWAQIKSRLESASIISKIHIARLATPETFIAITFSGTDEQLALALRQKGLILFRAGRGYALIRQEDAGRYLAERGE